jgi:predicted secreted Zn-dependent protease
MLSDMGFRGWHSVISSVVQYFEIRPSTNRILKNKFSKFYHIIFCTLQGHLGACGGAVGWGTALQAGRLQVRFPMVPLEFFIDILLATVWPWG